MSSYFLNGFITGANVMDQFQTRQLRREVMRSEEERRKEEWNMKKGEYNELLKSRAQKKNLALLSVGSTQVAQEYETKVGALQSRLDNGEIDEEGFQLEAEKLDKQYNNPTYFLNRAVDFIQRENPDFGNQMMWSNEAFEGKYAPTNSDYLDTSKPPVHSVRVMPNGEMAVSLNTVNGVQPITEGRSSSPSDNVHTEQLNMNGLMGVFGPEFVNHPLYTAITVSGTLPQSAGYGSTRPSGGTAPAASQGQGSPTGAPSSEDLGSPAGSQTLSELPPGSSPTGEPESIIDQVLGTEDGTYTNPQPESGRLNEDGATRMQEIQSELWSGRQRESGGAPRPPTPEEEEAMRREAEEIVAATTTVEEQEQMIQDRIRAGYSEEGAREQMYSDKERVAQGNQIAPELTGRVVDRHNEAMKDAEGQPTATQAGIGVRTGALNVFDGLATGFTGTMREAWDTIRSGDGVVGQFLEGVLGTYETPEDQEAVVEGVVSAQAEAPEDNSPPAEKPADVKSAGTKPTDYSAKRIANDPGTAVKATAGAAKVTDPVVRSSYQNSVGLQNGALTGGRRNRTPNLMQMYNAASLLKSGVVDQKAFMNYATSGSWAGPSTRKMKIIHDQKSQQIYAVDEVSGQVSHIGNTYGPEGREGSGTGAAGAKGEKAMRALLEDQLKLNARAAGFEEGSAQEARYIRDATRSIIATSRDNGWLDSGFTIRGNQIATDDFASAFDRLNQWKRTQNNEGEGILSFRPFQYAENKLRGREAHFEDLNGILAMDVLDKPTKDHNDIDEFMENVWWKSETLAPNATGAQKTKLLMQLEREAAQKGTTLEEELEALILEQTGN